MADFEKENITMDGMDGVHRCLLRSNPFQGSAEKLDLTRKRVEIYTDLIQLANTVQFTVLKMLTGYVASQDKFKCWKHQPDARFSEKRKVLMKVLHKKKNILQNILHSNRK